MVPNSPVCPRVLLCLGLQWVCRSCGSSTSIQDIPASPAVSCSQCSTSAGIVFDRPTGRVARFCLSCQSPNDNDWFSHGPLSRFASLHGLGRGNPAHPGSGTQSWLFYPLILLWLAVAESRMGVDRHQPTTALLQSWESGHLDSDSQEVVTPSHIMSMIEVWPSVTVTPFRQRDSPPSCCCDSCACPRCSSVLSLHSLSFCVFPSPQPFTVALPLNPPSRSPFASRNSPDTPRTVVARPFAQHPVPPPPRLPLFLEIPLDKHVNIVTAMIDDGPFTPATVPRLKGQTAWGVWLKISHWDSSQGRRARLLGGVLYHVGNNTLTFHGLTTTVRQLLLPLFQEWTFATLASLPLVSQVGGTQPALTPTLPVPSLPQPPPSNLTQIHFDNASLRSRHRPACHHALFARTGS